MSDQLRSLLGMKPEPLICKQTANTSRPTAEQEHNSLERKRNSLDRLFARHLQRGRNSLNLQGTKQARPTWQPSREADAEARSPTAKATGEPVAQLPTEFQKMLKVLGEPSTRQVIMQLLDLRYEEHFRTAYVAPALQAQVVEPTTPANPTSPNQRYRLIAKCVAMRRFLSGGAQGAPNP